VKPLVQPPLKSGSIGCGRALVTGGAGYIGANLACRLLERGWQVTVFDDLSWGRRERLAAVTHHPHFRFVQGDVTVDDRLRREIENADIVYHLAAMVGVRRVIEDPLECSRVNIQGTDRVLTFCRDHDKRVLFASSSEIYGRGGTAPLHEEKARELGQTHVDRWIYSTSKALGEHMAFAHHRRGLRVSVVRYFNSYGPGIDIVRETGVVGNLIRAAVTGEDMLVFGGGEQMRSFTFVDDTVAGTIAAAESDAAIGEAINIGNSTAVSIKDLATLIKAQVGSASRIVALPMKQVYGSNFEEAHSRRPCPEKAERLLGFVASVGLSEGIRRTLEWWRSGSMQLPLRAGSNAVSQFA
jgi:UDP-glucose 4-epimerase